MRRVGESCRDYASVVSERKMMNITALGSLSIDTETLNIRGSKSWYCGCKINGTCHIRSLSECLVVFSSRCNSVQFTL